MRLSRICQPPKTPTSLTTLIPFCYNTCMRKRLFLGICLLFLLVSFLPSLSFAQEGLDIAGQKSSIPQETFHKGTVIKIEKEGAKKIGNDNN